MSGGRLMRFAILAVLLVAPVAFAASPTSDRSSADATDGQDITDLGVDPTGEFTAVAVAFDAAKATSSSSPTCLNPLLPTCSTSSPTTNNHKDLYVCEYGTSEAPTSGTGCRGLRQVIPSGVTPTPNAPQHVATTFTDAGGRQGVYVLGGPDNRLSYWTHNSDTASWSTAVAAGNVVNVSIAADASRVVAATAPTASTQGGAIEVHYANGTTVWVLQLTNAAGAAVRPTSLSYSRTGSVLAIGTTDGLLLANPDIGAPSGALGGISQAQSVTEVATSTNGAYVAASASNGVFLAAVKGGEKPAIDASSIFNRGFSDPAQGVALSGDGSRFAAAAGNKIYFFRRLDTGAIAEPAGDPFDAGAPIADLAYSMKGDLLVAAAGNNVYGFGPTKNAPIWQFDATQSQFGGLDGPIKRVAVSDDAVRVTIAGKTRMNVFHNTLGVSATLNATSGATRIAPTQTLPLTLTVKNTGSLADNYSFVISTPVGWASASADSLSLVPEETGSVTFNVTAPAGQAPGSYGVQVRVRSEVSDALAQARNEPTSYLSGPTFNLTIPRSVVLNVSAPDDKLLLRQGGEQTVPVAIRNEGNAEGVVNLSTTQQLTRGSEWTITFEGGDQVHVPAASTLNVNMVITAPSDAGSGDRNAITIRAREGQPGDSNAVEATDQVIAYVNPQFGAELKTNQSTWEFYPGQTQSVKLNVTNIGNTDDTFNLTQTITPAAVANDWRVTIETDQTSIARGQTKQILVTIKAVASDAREANLLLKSISQSSPDKQENSLTLTLNVVPRPPTVTTPKSFLPAPGPLLVAGAVALLALVARRRGGRS